MRLSSAAMFLALCASSRALVVPPPSARGATLEVRELIACGQYGKVHAAQHDGRRVVAKCAAAANAGDEKLATSYFEVEHEVNKAILTSGDPSQRFCTYRGRCRAEGVEWLVWESLQPEGGTCPSLADFAGRPVELQAEHGLSPLDVLRELLYCIKALHELGYGER